MLDIYAEALDRLCVRLNMYLVVSEVMSYSINQSINHSVVDAPVVICAIPLAVFLFQFLSNSFVETLMEPAIYHRSVIVKFHTVL